MMDYYKEVEVSDTGMVIARVFEKSAQRRVGLEFFSNSWRFGEAGVKDKCERAHKWCDARIDTCIEQEANELNPLRDRIERAQ